MKKALQVTLWDDDITVGIGGRIYFPKVRGEAVRFTWDDVDDEREAYKGAVYLARHAQDRGDEAERKRYKALAERHSDRADKIAALLPPREP